MTEFCNVCPRECMLNRNIMTGFCNESNKIRIAKIIENFMWEEPCITGKKGTLAIFFSGCNLKCDYCQNYQISRGQAGKIYSIEEFIDLIEQQQEKHSTIDLITPTHFAEPLYEAFKRISKKIPVIWNTNGYETSKTIEKVSAFVDVFLTDFKYADNSLALKFSKCTDYFENCLNATKTMCQLKPDIYKDDLLTQGVVLRHLVLPGHVKNSLAVIDCIKEHFPNRKISLMSQFTPNGRSELSRPLNAIEYKAVLAHAEKLGLSNGYIQDFSSANSCFIPNFE